ncbi:hypothetical protein YC2023_086555 [Brassica napus]
MAESSLKYASTILCISLICCSFSYLIGHIDVELNDAGRQQAVRVAERLSKEPRRLLRSLLLNVITDPDLRERHLGDMQGLVYQEASKIRPIAYKAFLSNRTDVDIPPSGNTRVNWIPRHPGSTPPGFQRATQ